MRQTKYEVVRPAVRGNGLCEKGRGIFILADGEGHVNSKKERKIIWQIREKMQQQ